MGTNLLSDKRYLDAVAKSCERLDRILSGSDTLTVKVDYSNGPLPVPAYQSNGRLFMVPAQMERMVADNTDENEVLPLLLALDLHELAHFEYSPTPDNRTWRTLDREYINGAYRRSAAIGDPRPEVLNEAYNRQGRLRPMLNALEDQRIELLISTRYPKSRDYLRLAVLHGMWMLNKSKDGIPPENYLLYYGRRHFLPRPLLNRLRAQMVTKYGEPAIQEAESLITEYATLTASDTADLTRMHAIGTRLTEMFTKDPSNPSGVCIEHSSMSGRTTTKRDQKRAADAGKTVLREIDEHNRQADADKSADQKSDDSDGSQNDDASKGESEESDESDDDADETDDEDADTDDDGMDADPIGMAGKSAKSSKGDDMSRAIREYLSKSSAKVAGDMGDRTEEIRVIMHGGTAQRLARLLREVSTDLRETDFNRLRSGKLDIRRVPAALANNDSQIFRRRQESLESEAVMGTHVMIDVSGSMAGEQVQVALDAGYTIAKASEIAGHFTKVSTFASTDETVLEWGQPADTLTRQPSNVGGGTQPLQLLTDALSDFQRAGGRLRFRNFAIILITDGVLGQPDKCGEQLARMHAAGVSILLVGINAPVATYTGRKSDGSNGTHEYAADGRITIATVNELEAHMRTYLKRIAVQIARRVLRNT